MARAQVFDTTSLAAAGLRVIRRAGWPAVTMRSVAAELHVSPMALYRLTPTAPHLHHLIANATAPPDPPTPDDPPPVVPRPPVVPPTPVIALPPVAAPPSDDPPPDSPWTQATAAAAAPVEPLASGQSTELPLPRDAVAAAPGDPLPDVPPRPASAPTASALSGRDAPPSSAAAPNPPALLWGDRPGPPAMGGGLGEVLWVWAVEAYGHLRGLPGVASYVVLHWTELPAWLDVVEALLAKAEDAALSGPSAVATVNAVFAYVLVRAQLHDGLAAAPRRSIAPLRDDPARYPSLHRNRSEFARAQTDRHFEFGLAALIAGLSLAR